MTEDLFINCSEADAGLLGNLGRAYRDGRGVKRNLEKSAYFFKSAYEKKPSWGGELFDVLWDINTEESRKLMIDSAEKLAAMGDGDALGHLGKAYYFGRGVEKNQEKALNYMRKACEKNIRWAKNRLFDMLWTVNSPTSINEMVKLVESRLHESVADAFVQMAKMFREGRGKPHNLREAAKWYRIAIEKGDIQSKNELYDVLIKNNTPETKKEALSLLQEFDHSDNKGSIARIARAYRYGIFYPKDPKKAIEFYEKAAALGLNWARYELFDTLKEIHDPTSLQCALTLATEGANNNDIELMGRLALLYLNGEGVAQSTEEAIKWLRLANTKSNRWINELYYALWNTNDPALREQAIDLVIKDHKLATENNLANIVLFLITKRIVSLGENNILSKDMLIPINKNSVLGIVPKELIPCFEYYTYTAHVVNEEVIIVKKTVDETYGTEKYAITCSKEYYVCNINGHVFATPSLPSQMLIYPIGSGLPIIIDFNTNKLLDSYNVIEEFDQLNPIIWHENRRLLGFYDYYLSKLSDIDSMHTLKDSYIDYYVHKYEKPTEEYNIVMCSDKNLVDMLMVTIGSMHTNLNRKLKIWFLQSDYTPDQKELLENYCNSLDISATFVDVNPEDYKHVYSNRYLPKAAFYYLLAHLYLPTNVERALYIDPDTLVLKDISDFYDIDFENTLICVCNEFNESFTHGQNDPPNYMFFNSGVVLLNLNKMREEAIGIDTISQPYIDNKINVDYADQRLLNYLFWNKAKIMPRKYYNCFVVDLGVYISDHFNQNEDISETESYPFDYTKLASIIHYAGGHAIKPWDLPYIQFKDGSSVSYKDTINSMQNEYIKKWWEFAQSIPTDSLNRLYLRNKKAARTKNISEFVDACAHRKIVGDNWMVTYLIKYLLQKNDEETIKCIIKNIDDVYLAKYIE